MLLEAAAAVLVIALVLKLFGCFDSAEVSTTSDPEVFKGGITVYYKYNVGAYGAAYGVCRELMQLIPNGAARGFGIFYDDPAKVPTHLLQSAVGVIVQVGSEALVQPIIIEQLQRRGLEKMVIPAISRSVTSSCQMNLACALLPASLNPITKMYTAMMDYAKSNSLTTTVSMELYTLSSSLFTVHLPLDHLDEFVVPEKLSTDDLKDKIACAKFDSDASSSESEPSGDEEYPDEGEESEVAGGDKKDQ
ncbi:hypothetical protein PENTCL1PPCAC_7469 [Pristionchus entomophagus]|uniref:Uncharacterized protein n=1 Tax=Pristionchus entomophagus TaxID=358040 RepID=A0AAV5SQY5_9BILA|nr:hypothetical protein PENTCL1PPCAC_7469 [Pristionchus entomophagus]